MEVGEAASGLVQVGEDGDSGPEGGRRGRIVNTLWKHGLWGGAKMGCG